MPPKNNSEKLPFQPRPDLAIEWYREIDFNSSLTGQEHTLVTGAQSIFEKNPNGFVDGDPAQPYWTEAGCMLYEASRLTEKTEQASQYRAVARKAFAKVESNIELPMSARIDALMYLSDLDMQDLYDEYFRNDLEAQEFEERWVNQHLLTMKALHAAEKEFRDDETYSLGKLFEWYWVIDRRQHQLRQENTDRYFIRAAFTREDRSHLPLTEGKSANYDVALDEFVRGSWQTRERAQLGIGKEKTNKYRPEIKVYQYSFNMNNDEFIERLLAWVDVMAKEAKSIFDERLVLNFSDKELLEQEAEFYESYVTN